MKDTPSIIVPDDWEELRSLTRARIALGRAGGSLPVAHRLDFLLAHAAARDAVQEPLDTDTLLAGLRHLDLDVILLNSCALDRLTYLSRPDLGRRLSQESRERLAGMGGDVAEDCDVAVILSDGLSAGAVTSYGALILSILVPLLQGQNLRIGPIAIVKHGRVAIQDEVGELLGARLALIFLGERPGLDSPRSLSAYFVHNPKQGNTDANRNCISNIRQGGLEPEPAAKKLNFLILESLRRKLSGVHLKDELPTAIPKGIALLE